MANSSSEEIRIINQYQYTDVLMEEVQSEYAKQSYKNSISLFVIALICAFFTRREYVTQKMALSILFAIVGVVCLGAVVAVFVTTRRKTTAAIKEFHEAYHGKGFEYKITIEGNHIRSYRDGTEIGRFRKGDIRGTLETERFFVFQMGGEQLLPMKKGSFIKGNVDACRRYAPHVVK